MLGEPPVGRYHYQAFLHKRVRVPLPLIVLLLAGWLVVVGYRAVAWLILDFSSAGPCPRCNTVFSMINTTNSEDRVKIVEIQQRGEPKSGTTFMYQWAHGALVHTCEYLRQWYGQDTCHLERSTPIGRQKGFHEGIVLKFTPRRRSVLRSRCPCDEVDRCVHVDIHSVCVIAVGSSHLRKEPLVVGMWPLEDGACTCLDHSAIRLFTPPGVLV